jgi:peroxiredoxin
MKKLTLYFVFILSTILVAYGQVDATTFTKVGDKAPLFICKTIDGKTFDIAKSLGKIIMINFFATWCGPCNLELPVLQKNVWEKYRNNPDFSLIILGREHNNKEVEDFVTKKGFTMPFAADPGRAVFKLFASQSIPRNVIIGKDGKIVFQSIGYTPEEFRKLETFLADRLR